MASTICPPLTIMSMSGRRACANDLHHIAPIINMLLKSPMPSTNASQHPFISPTVFQEHISRPSGSGRTNYVQRGHYHIQTVIKSHVILLYMPWLLSYSIALQISCTAW